MRIFTVVVALFVSVQWFTTAVTLLLPVHQTHTHYTKLGFYLCMTVDAMRYLIVIIDVPI